MAATGLSSERVRYALHDLDRLGIARNDTALTAFVYYGVERSIPQAVALLKGAGLPIEEADEQRDRLLVGFRWILVDEYQDIAADQYELISALASRSLDDPERKLNLFAVGDDDQNIYVTAANQAIRSASIMPQRRRRRAASGRAGIRSAKAACRSCRRVQTR
jgi:hypothetical protein